MSNAGSYALRIQRVVDYLAEHLDEVLDRETLSRVAGTFPKIERVTE